MERWDRKRKMRRKLMLKRIRSEMERGMGVVKVEDVW